MAQVPYKYNATTTSGQTPNLGFVLPNLTVGLIMASMLNIVSHRAPIP
jgi:hypothetical protein